MKILGTSFLYESLPMYYEAQAEFYNNAVKVDTNLPPMELMEALQLIQRILDGRKELKTDVHDYCTRRIVRL